MIEDPAASVIADDEREMLRAALPAYELQGVLGRGAFAVVYTGVHTRLKREVAIKRLSPGPLSDPNSRARFTAEAQLLATLDHQHIVRIYDYAESESVCALVMERLHGGTLADRMRIERPPPARACAIVLATLHGLEHAHQHGVLHRDIKPENLLFGERDLVKVADFGIAKVLRARGAGLTATADTLGTPAYMAPEQVRREIGPLCAATDVWATAAVLYELLAGEPPFPRAGSDLAEVLVRRVTDEPRDLRNVAPQLPTGLAEVVMRALRRDPRERFQSAFAFAGALENAVDETLGAGSVAATGIPIHRSDPPRSPTPTLTDTDPLPSPAIHRRRRRLRHPRALGAAGAALAAAAVAVAVVLIVSAGSPRNAVASLPTPPPGWPAKLTIGSGDELRTYTQYAKYFGKGGMTQLTFGGDPATGHDWSHLSVVPYDFVHQSTQAGLFPFADVYMLRRLGRGTNPEDGGIQDIKRAMVNPRLMRAYWDNVRKMMIGFGRANAPVAISIELSSWALLEQDLGFTSSQPTDLHVVVGSSGLPELKGMPDDLGGFQDAWTRLRNRYAPKALLGMALDFFGTNLDIGKTLPTHAALIAAADQQARFFLEVSQNGPLDFASFDIPAQEQGLDPHAPYPTDVYKRNVLDWVREFVTITGRSAMLESVPTGNTVMKTIDDKPYHYHDHWVQWLTDDNFKNLRAFRNAGLIGLAFATSYDNTATCPCDAAKDGITNGGKTGIVSHSSDDDGGFLHLRLTALNREGGLSLQ